MDLIKHVLTSTYFLYDSLFYKKKGRVVPVVAKFYMKHFEQGVISTVINKPPHWYKYVDKKLLIGHMERGVTKISETFKCYLPKIKFTTETEENAALPFLDILVTVRFDVMLWHTTNRKPTNTDLYLHTKSEHHPAQKLAILATQV